jgi:uracil-DNA glycosylase family 4
MNMTSPIMSPVPDAEPPRDCQLCPRLVAHREACRAEFPTWWNGPIPAFGDPAAQIVIVGPPSSKHGANRTGRAFTGEFGAALLFSILEKYGLAEDKYNARLDDGLKLIDCAILTSVKCLPPQNKATPEEIRTCRQFLDAEVASLPNARIFIALGQVAHQSIVKVLGGRLPKAPFAHLAEHRVPDGRVIIDSHQSSFQNTSSGLLTDELFDAVFERAVALRREG